MRIIAFLAAAACVVSVISTALGAHISRWEVIMLECGILCWILIAWILSEDKL